MGYFVQKIKDFIYPDNAFFKYKSKGVNEIFIQGRKINEVSLSITETYF